MAEKTSSTEPKKAPKNTPQVPSEGEQVANQPRHKKPWMIAGLVAAGLLVIVLIVIAATYALEDKRKGLYGKKDATSGSQYIFEQRVGGYGRGQTSVVSSEGNTVTTTVYKTLTGVVTEVSGEKIVVAGGGTATTIEINGETSYIRGVEPKVNDTVVVWGVTTDDTITATHIRVDNGS